MKKCFLGTPYMAMSHIRLHYIKLPVGLIVLHKLFPREFRTWMHLVSTTMEILMLFVVNIYSRTHFQDFTKTLKHSSTFLQILFTLRKINPLQTSNTLMYSWYKNYYVCSTGEIFYAKISDFLYDLNNYILGTGNGMNWA